MRQALTVLIVVLSFCFGVKSAAAATLYWVGAEGAAVGEAGNWASSDPASCMPEEGIVPGPGDIIVFDADCDRGATVTTNLTVTVLSMQAGYEGKVRQLPGTTVTTGSFSQAGGVYDTNGGLLMIGAGVIGLRPTPEPTMPPAGRLSELVPEARSVVPNGILDVGLTALATTASLATLSSMPGLFDLIRSFFPLLGAGRRRRRPVGRVINVVDGIPLGGALVHIFDVTTNRLRETILTGVDGVFGTLLPPGTYLFSVRKPGYAPVFAVGAGLLFPGEQLATEQPITVQEEGTVIPLVFVMRRMAPYALRERWRAGLVRGGRVLQINLARMALPLLLLGASINVVALLRRPSWLLFGVTVLYLFFLGLELVVSRRFQRAFGRVLDAAVKKPVALVGVRLFDPATRRILQTRVTTTGGQYLMLAPRGDYQLQFAHPTYQPLDHKVSIRPALGSPVVLDADLVPRQT